MQLETIFVGVPEVSIENAISHSPGCVAASGVIAPNRSKGFAAVSYLRTGLEISAILAGGSSSRVSDTAAKIGSGSISGEICVSGRFAIAAGAG